MSAVADSTIVAPSREAGIKAAEEAYRAEQSRARMRRRLLPAAGIAALIGVWAALVYLLKVPTFVAPSPALPIPLSIFEAPSAACWVCDLRSVNPISIRS